MADGTPPEGQPNRQRTWLWWVGLIAFAVITWPLLINALGSDDSTSAAAPTPTATRPRPTPTPRPRPQTVTVRYYVEPHRSPGMPGQPAASITYTNAQGGIEQIAHYPGPWDLVFEARSGTIVSLSAQNQLDHGGVICRIYLKGQLWKESVSSGGYTIATCSGVVGME